MELRLLPARLAGSETSIDEIQPKMHEDLKRQSFNCFDDLNEYLKVNFSKFHTYLNSKKTPMCDHSGEIEELTIAFSIRPYRVNVNISV